MSLQKKRKTRALFLMLAGAPGLGLIDLQNTDTEISKIGNAIEVANLEAQKLQQMYDQFSGIQSSLKVGLNGLKKIEYSLAQLIGTPSTKREVNTEALAAYVIIGSELLINLKSQGELLGQLNNNADAFNGILGQAKDILTKQIGQLTVLVKESKRDLLAFTVENILRLQGNPTSLKLGVSNVEIGELIRGNLNLTELVKEDLLSAISGQQQMLAEQNPTMQFSQNSLAAMVAQTIQSID